MRYGVCFGIDSPERVYIAANAGFDYVECSFSGLAREDETVFRAYKKALADTGLKCERANGFIPGDLPLTGQSMNKAALCDYIRKWMQRGCEIGLETVVFGSGRARQLPEGLNYCDGFTAIADFMGKIACPIAGEFNINIAVEPLRKDECNIINTLREGVLLAFASGAKNAFCLVDLYHMLGAGESEKDIIAMGAAVKHAHISYPVSADGRKRCYPDSSDGYDYAPFIAALEAAGVQTCSVEANCLDFEKEAPEAVKRLKSI